MRIKFCKKCQAYTERNANCGCKPCKRAYNIAYIVDNADKKKAITRAWRKKNKENVRKHSRTWRAANPEKAIENHRAYYEANKEKVKSAVAKYQSENMEKIKSWRKANPEKLKAIRQNRRARELNAPGTHTSADIRELFTLQKGKCPVCKTSINDGYHIDHVMPLARGGSNDKLNLQLLCQPCNNQKHAKHPIDFMQSKGFLL